MRRLKYIATLVVATCAAASYALIREFQPQVGRHLSASKAPAALSLPSDAADICFYIHGAFGPCDLYEFNISQIEFEGWSAKHGYHLKRIIDPFHIKRFGFSTNVQTDPSDITLSSGLLCVQVDPVDIDVRTEVSFDTSLQRAFVSDSFR